MQNGNTWVELPDCTCGTAAGKIPLAFDKLTNASKATCKNYPGECPKVAAKQPAEK